MDYLLFVVVNLKKGLELAAEATQYKSYVDWWWKERLARCYYKLGLYHDA